MPQSVAELARFVVHHSASPNTTSLETMARWHGGTFPYPYWVGRVIRVGIPIDQIPRSHRPNSHTSGAVLPGWNGPSLNRGRGPGTGKRRRDPARWNWRGLDASWHYQPNVPDSQVDLLFGRLFPAVQLVTPRRVVLMGHNDHIKPRGTLCPGLDIRRLYAEFRECHGLDVAQPLEGA